MTHRDRWLHSQRAAAWAFGMRHRQELLARYMADRGLRDRPLLNQVIDDLIEELQGARLIEEVLPLNRFAQTETDRGRIVVSINSRIGEIPGVKDPSGVANVAKWHESVHVARHVTADPGDATAQLFLPGLDAPRPRLIVCRTAGPGAWRGCEREFFAENAGLAAAVAPEDLARCEAFRILQQLASVGGELGPKGWRLLYATARFIGINASALVRYFEHRGFIYVVERQGRQRLMATPQLFGGLEWFRLDPEPNGSNG